MRNLSEIYLGFVILTVNSVTRTSFCTDDAFSWLKLEMCSAFALYSKIRLPVMYLDQYTSIHIPLLGIVQSCMSASEKCL